MNCNLCPRKCNVDRRKHTAFCGQYNTIKVSRASLHMWEEPLISGTKGSGTVFFSGCNLGCVFCQNYDIAMNGKGRQISSRQLADIFLRLQDAGANNINLVTAGHFLPEVIKTIELVRNKSLTIPIVYNTSAYESLSAIHSLDGLIDIYLPDMKYYSPDISLKYSKASDYFEVASSAIEEMVRQTGGHFSFTDEDTKTNHYNISDYEDLCEDKNLIMTKGVVVRHLLLPGCYEDSRKIIEYLYGTFGDHIFISIMNQYTPMNNGGIIKDKYPELLNKVSPEEYNSLLDYAIELGLNNGFFQEGDVATESFIPDFDSGEFLDFIS